MDIQFSDRQVRKLCEDASVARKKLGAEVAKKLQIRLNELRVAAHLDELVTGRPHPLKGDLRGCFGITLHGGVRLVIRPAHDPLPLRPGGDLDRRSVTAVTIESIGDYHD